MVTLLEVLENSGYDVLHNVDDAKWLLSRNEEMEGLLNKAEELIEEEE